MGGSMNGNTPTGLTMPVRRRRRQRTPEERRAVMKGLKKALGHSASPQGYYAGGSFGRTPGGWIAPPMLYLDGVNDDHAALTALLWRRKISDGPGVSQAKAFGAPTMACWSASLDPGGAWAVGLTIPASGGLALSAPLVMPPGTALVAINGLGDPWQGKPTPVHAAVAHAGAPLTAMANAQGAAPIASGILNEWGPSQKDPS